MTEVDDDDREKKNTRLVDEDHGAAKSRGFCTAWLKSLERSDAAASNPMSGFGKTLTNRQPFARRLPFRPVSGVPPNASLLARAPVDPPRNRSLISLAELALFSPPEVGAPRAQAPRLHGPRREAGAVSVFRSPGVGLFAPSQRSHVLYLTSPFCL